MTALPSDHFLGLGLDSVKFSQVAVVIQQPSTITGLTLSIRDNTLGAGDVVTGTIFVSRNCGNTLMNTNIVATVSGPVPANPCFQSVTGSFSVLEGDLVSVQVVTSGGALPDGAAATISLSIP
jgi:hypothetical protein